MIDSRDTSMLVLVLHKVVELIWVLKIIEVVVIIYSIIFVDVSLVIVCVRINIDSNVLV